MTGQLALTPEQIANQMALPKAERLCIFDAHKIIYPGKNHDAWWDLEQLQAQTIDAVNIFEYLHPDKIGVWLFDCSLAHEGLAADALHVNNMNVNPGGKQKLSWDVMSECTALLDWKLAFGGVSDSGFSSCTVPTYYCGSEYFLVSIHKFRT